MEIRNRAQVERGAIAGGGINNYLIWKKMKISRQIRIIVYRSTCYLFHGYEGVYKESSAATSFYVPAWQSILQSSLLSVFTIGPPTGSYSGVTPLSPLHLTVITVPISPTPANI